MYADVQGVSCNALLPVPLPAVPEMLFFIFTNEWSIEYNQPEFFPQFKQIKLSFICEQRASRYVI